MATISSPRTTGLEGTDRRLALAVADANWFTTENLFREVQRDNVSTLLLKCMDYCNAWRRGQPPWAWGRALTRRGPGPLAARPGPAQRLDEAVPELGDAADRPVDPRLAAVATPRDGRLVLVMTYPHYLYLRDLVRPDRHGLLQPRRLRAVLAAVGPAGPRAGAPGGARGRPDGLRLAAPRRGAARGGPRGGRPDPPPAARRPVGVAGRAPVGPARAAARRPRRPAPAAPRLRRLARRPGRLGAPDPPERGAARAPRSCSSGGPGRDGTGAWYDDCRRCLARPNVHALGWRPQDADPPATTGPSTSA